MLWTPQKENLKAKYFNKSKKLIHLKDILENALFDKYNSKFSKFKNLEKNKLN